MFSFVHFKTKKKKLRGFSRFTKNKKLLTQIFKIFFIHKPSLGSRDVPKKIGPDQFNCFDVYWIHTNKHPDIEAKIYK